MRLADYTTLRVGGSAKELLVAATREQLLEAVTGQPEALILAGGSNVVIGDGGYAGRVILIRTSGIEEVPTAGEVLENRVRVRVQAGVEWSHFVDETVRQGFSGVELLAGIPGSVGATPIQNVGAYGMQISDVFAEAEVLDRNDGRVEVWGRDQWQFGYRTSRLRESPQSHVVLSVTFELIKRELSPPLHYPSLIELLQVPSGAQVRVSEARDAVLAVRRSRGMVLESSDHDTWSVGSFFVNPVMTEAEARDLPTLAPRWPASATDTNSQAGSSTSELVKTSAAWLIEHAGFHQGYAFERAALSGKHVLAITNRGGATCNEVVTLASLIRDRVLERTGVLLTPEPRLINCHLTAINKS